MPTVTITINNQTILDDALGEWQTNPPDLLKETLAANRAPAPHLQHVLMALARAGMTDHNTTITVNTRPDGYTLEVKETP